jgi:hypothetical protein
MADASKESGASVKRKTTDNAAKPDGESPYAKSQPPKLPKIQKYER